MRRSRITLWLVAGLLGLVAGLPASAAPRAVPEPSAATSRSDEEILKEFKKYFRKYKDTPTRVEAVLSLEGVDSPRVVDVLVPLLRDDEPELVRAVVRILATLKAPESVTAMLTELEETSRDEIRLGLLSVVAEAQLPGAEPFVTPLLESKDWEVRRLGVLALTALGGETASVAIASLTSDGEVAVRCAALDGLSKLRSELVVEPAITALESDSWQVRASAVAALAVVRRREAIPPLIARMSAEEGRLLADIGVALGEITGRDFGQRIDGWKSWWKLYETSFVVPTDAELARLREAQAKRREEYSPSGTQTVDYYGIETPSRSVLFVIDVSGSMESTVVDRDRFADGEYPSFRRIDIVKTELQRTIQGLDSYVRFNILAFATEVKTWKKDLVAANVLNKSSAVEWAGKLEPLGGASNADLADVGLVGGANLEAGKTNTHGALMSALGIDLEGKRRGGPDYEVDVDTIFFLSDGRPSHGKYVDANDILREVREANDLRKVVIHTIALGQFRKDFMKRLAEENGGVFVDLGK